MTVSVIPTLPLLTLSQDEEAVLLRLNNRRTVLLPDLQLRDSYYNGNQIIRDLGIAIPPQVRGLSTVVGWPMIAVDALDERLDVQGFRYTGAVDGDDELNGVWQANNLDEESQLAHLDSLIYGCAYACVGSNIDGSPLITVESARDVSTVWDPRWRAITAALRVYGGDEYGRFIQATLYLPNVTISLERSATGWDVIDRDQHNLGEVPVARLANRQRVAERDGHSEITRQIMSITDQACRTLLGLEVAREFFAAPQRWMMGASESAFVGPDGTKKTPWETYIGRILALEADDNGNLPQVGQFQPGDPSAYTRVMDMLRQEMAALTHLPPHMLGETSQNPASADAIRSAEHGLVKRAERCQRAFSGGWEAAIRLALRVMNNGALPPGAERIETIWASAATPTPAATTDALFKQISAGMVPAQSDVVREKAGYSVEERKRLAEEDKQFAGQEFLAQLAHSLIAKDSRTDKAVAGDLGVPTKPTAPSGPVAGQ